ncbi:MAG: peptide-methionine (S)-S-oxide reductase MsrA [Saprospiraceae bacterium]|jgi:peptide-methionine (S)-S-oxide reductase|nr:peptide-methionine (S)-S-oxide reductase MsrA [Saprospiraceae bacterium]MDP4699407.1 peptide-methionine (S)-S-oxide reductase MsrA [Saprospiraceae bacterium]MDP4810887.1 peptide-methionine (S)-S-oxide reductase MsrA [Saprospiraceae bacterium]MDP4813701.1 peptide-methionine (S)-S-oxide reductase MsrA [Saprospiraceae bacterium]MDP4853498.1 peptide-methionine (S)-S-oxide reductase MsrA [Saprospiraceae bacterium]
MNEIILGGGCFWCLEAAFQLLKGVESVQSGYAGGTKETAAYKEVCSGQTNHAEVVKIIYDSEIISLDDLLRVFWQIHNPTTLNKQGNDVGPQYRSIIFYADDKEREIIELSIEKEAKPIWGSNIVTFIEKSKEFYPAEGEHNNYFQKVGDRNPYCTYVVKPKVTKVIEKFSDKLKNL